MPKATIIGDEAKGLLESTISKLNSNVNGQYIFSGDDLYNAPVNNAAALDTSMSTLVTGWLTGTTATAVASDARAQTGTALGYSSTLRTPGNVSFMADSDINIDYTQQAYQGGYADIMRGMSIISNLPQPTTATEQTNYWNVVNGVINLLQQGRPPSTPIKACWGTRRNKPRIYCRRIPKPRRRSRNSSARSKTRIWQKHPRVSKPCNRRCKCPIASFRC